MGRVGMAVAQGGLTLIQWAVDEAGRPALRRTRLRSGFGIGISEYRLLVKKCMSVPQGYL